MNQRLIELYRQASEFAYKVCQDEGRTGGPSDHIWHTLSTGRFAELIVQECAYAARQCYTVRAVDAQDVATHIEEYFSVKQPEFDNKYPT